MRALLLLVLCAGPLAGQQASAYVPLDHWVMPYVEHLIASGILADPAPLTRPLREADLVRALRNVDTLTTSGAVTETVRRLLAAFTTEQGEQGPHYRLEGNLGFAAATYAKRDPLAAIDSAGPRAAGPKHGFVNGGMRLDRNWGPSGVQGLLLSDNPYGLDHLAITLGTTRLQLQAIATQLDDSTDSTGALVHRYMVQHRLWLRPSDDWSFALWEGSVLSGAGREFEPWYLNVMNVGYIEQLNTGTNVNNFAGFDFERRGDVTVFGQLMLDDIQVDRKSAADKKPISYALTAGAQGRVGGGTAWTLFYTRVSNLVYRNEDNLQVPLYHLLGTGRNFADYDQVTFTLGLLPRAGLLVAPELTLLRQGEGDPRLPHPLISAYPTTATFLQGVVERTLRVALSGSYAPGVRFGLRFDAGMHRINNYLHLTGQTRTKFVGSVAVSYRFSRGGALP